MIIVRPPILSSLYASDTIAVPDGVKCHPHWTVTMGAKDRFEWETYGEMEVWLADNIADYRLHRFGVGASSIEAVTFRNRDDATLFYLRFV